MVVNKKQKTKEIRSGSKDYIETGEAAQLLEREEGEGKKGEEEAEGGRGRGSRKYRGERATRDVRLSLTQLLGRRGGHAVEEDAAKYSREHAKRDVRLKRRGRAKQRAGDRQTRGGEAIAWRGGRRW
ncbi:hypothetical protein PMAC_001352, partial [Pneumocystis sp. 'macacae']